MDIIVKTMADCYRDPSIDTSRFVTLLQEAARVQRDKIQRRSIRWKNYKASLEN